jgi:hypothetical protein
MCKEGVRSAFAECAFVEVWQTVECGIEGVKSARLLGTVPVERVSRQPGAAAGVPEAERGVLIAPAPRRRSSLGRKRSSHPA